MIARFALSVLMLVAPLTAQRVELYLQSGGEILVREYEVNGDRVRYYSLERSAWEEIPVSLIDLEKTEKAVARRQSRLESMRAESALERAAERKARTELHNVPIEEGIYFYLDNKTTEIAPSEVVIDKDKKQGFLKVVSPIPIVAGKNLLMIDGEQARFSTPERTPIFFVRQRRLSHFGLVRLQAAKKERRLVQTVLVNPVSKELYEEAEEVEVFRQQLASGVYRVWPMEPLEPGEYAIVDYTPGELDLRVWDFSIAASGETGASAAP